VASRRGEETHRPTASIARPVPVPEDELMGEHDESSRQLPGWSRFARRLFKGLIGVWATVYLVRGLVWGGSKVFGYTAPDPLGDTSVIFGVFVALAALAGASWLIGEGVAGFGSRD
jgi:hypothetical protein